MSFLSIHDMIYLISKVNRACLGKDRKKDSSEAPVDGK